MESIELGDTGIDGGSVILVRARRQNLPEELPQLSSENSCLFASSTLLALVVEEASVVSEEGELLLAQGLIPHTVLRVQVVEDSLEMLGFEAGSLLQDVEDNFVVLGHSGEVQEVR